MVAWLVPGLLGLLVVLMVCWLAVKFFFGWLFFSLGGWSVFWFVDILVSWLIEWLVGWYFGCLVSLYSYLCSACFFLHTVCQPLFLWSLII